MRHVLYAGVLTLLGAAAGFAAELEDFVGKYSGSAEVQFADGTVLPRDMSVVIEETRDGFSVAWTSVTYREDGRTKEATYQIDFAPSGRGQVFAAAQKKNVFGHATALDPMKGEPYVWARLVDDTLTVFSLFVAEDGGYEIQQFDRTLVDTGLELSFQRFSNGEKMRAVTTVLSRE
jgi:hypothetical protein